MNMHAPFTIPIVEILTDPETGKRIGYTLTGDIDGPTILIVGHSRAIEAAFDWICERHDLSSMSGVLCFLYMGAVDNVSTDRINCPLLPTIQNFDEVHFLPFAPGVSYTPQAGRQGARSIVRLCRRMHILPRRQFHPSTDQQYRSGPTFCPSL